MKIPFLKTLRQVKRLIVIVVGYTILLVGIAMMVLPGPAFIVIPIGLGILATEVVWARRLLNKYKDKFQSMRDKGNRKKPPPFGKE